MQVDVSVCYVVILDDVVKASFFLHIHRCKGNIKFSLNRRKK
jgi:hypothetical protein